jgi:hypothetical protein
MEREPQLSSRIAPLLHEIARTSETGPEQSWQYIASFMKDGLGIPEYLINSTLSSIGAPAELAHERQVMADLTGDLSPQAQSAITRADREAARAEMSVHEKNTRAPQGTPEWAAYWRDPAAQQAYQDAISRSLVEAPVMPTMPAVEAPAAAPVTPAPVPAPAIEAADLG